MPKDADFKAREFREAVRNILQGYRKEYLAIGDALVESVLQKFNDGVPMTRAVEDAIRDVGFFGANAQAVSQMLFLAACAGYGVLPKFVAAPSEADIKRKLTETAWTGDGMKLSKRLHALPVRNNIVSALGIALRQVKSIKDIAMELYDGYNSGKGILSKATLRKDMAKLLRTAEAALGDDALMRDLRRQAVKLQSLPHGIQSPRLQAVYNELVKACTADELKAAAIKRAAWAAVEEKTRYHAERIARTEAARAWFDGYIAARENDEDVWGYRWQLSSRHHLCPFDQCDVCANMDVGYGKGIYPKHKVPSIPRHPHCMCMLEDVFSWERKGKRIKPEGARRYIDSIDEQKKRALFGDAGLEAYEKGGDWQKLLRGWDGFKKPKSRLSARDFKFDLQLFANSELNHGEKAALMRYVSGDAYRLNEKLRAGGSLSIEGKRWVQDLDAALDKMPSYRGALQRSLFFYEKERLQSFLDQHVKGKKVQYPAYTSMSAGSEAYNPYGQVQLFVLESRRGKDIRQFNDDEHEVLYPRGSRFRVKRVDRADGKHHIYMEELADD